MRLRQVRLEQLAHRRRLVVELGDRARAATAAEAAAAGDIVVVTVPLKAYRQVPVEPLRGKVVIDTNNYYPQRDDTIAELEDESTTVSELLQAHLPESHVVKAFNNIHFSHLAGLARPAGDPERSVLAIAGNDEGAEQTVTGFLDEIGYDTVDAGPLSEGWRFQRDTAAYGTPYTEGWGTAEMRERTGDAARVRELLAQSRRYRDPAA